MTEFILERKSLLLPHPLSSTTHSHDDDVTTMRTTKPTASWKNTNWRCKCQQVVRSKTHNTLWIFVSFRLPLNQIRRDTKMLIDSTCDMKWNEIFIISFLPFVPYTAHVVPQHVPAAVKRSDIDIFAWKQVYAENSQLSHERFRKLQVCERFSIFPPFFSWNLRNHQSFLYISAILIEARYWLWWRQWRDCVNDFLCMFSEKKTKKKNEKNRSKSNWLLLRRSR